jgi:hypothetical protein
VCDVQRALVAMKNTLCYKEHVMLLLSGRVIVALALAASLSAAAQAEYMKPLFAEASAAELAVREVVERHITGIAKADAKQIESAWDTEAGRITFVGRGKEGQEVVESGLIADSIALWTKEAKPTAGEIVSVDIAGDRMAFVKAQISWNGQTYDDYLVLLLTGGEWKLVSKTYSVAGGREVGGYGVTRASR